MKVQRVGRWLPPSVGTLKINADGSSRGNPRPVGIGRVGRDCSGSVIFFFSIHKGQYSNKFMEGLVILWAIERACALGSHRIIYESDSYTIANILHEQKVVEVNCQLALVV